MVYQWKDGARFPGDAQHIGEHLEWLRVNHSGLTARLVVDDAKAEDSPTHEAFTWADDEAADLWRLHQARVMLACIVVTNDDARLQSPTRAFVVVRESDEQHYTSIQHVMADAALMDQVLQRALRELEAFRRKYGNLQQLSPVLDAIKTVTERPAE